MACFPKKISGGTCIEVIEHLHPDQLRELVAELSRISEKGALFLFNSGQPEYVKNENPGYLDPFKRGHIVSYSIQGLRTIFSQYGFEVIPLPGRTWAFLAEFDRSPTIPNADDLMARLWNALPANVDKLKNNGFGALMYSAGLDSARCYLESSISQWRGGELRRFMSKHDFLRTFLKKYKIFKTMAICRIPAKIFLKK